MAISVEQYSVSKSIIINGVSRRPLPNFRPPAWGSVPAAVSSSSSSRRRRFTSLCWVGKPAIVTAMASVIEKSSVTDGGTTVIGAEQNGSGRRPAANFAPSIWGSSLASLSVSSAEVESYSRKVAELKEEVKNMLMTASSAKAHPLQNIEFIDHLERLGVSYHFEAEIEEQLSLVFDSLPRRRHDDDNNVVVVVEDYPDDLYSASLLFRVLRQNGYNVSCDLFNKFKDVNGNFKEKLKSDVRGILSLYEASHVILHGEDILEEALAFARASLEEYLLLLDSSPHDHNLVEHIKNALIWPFHRSSRRIEAVKYISFYAQEQCMNETVLNFAKLDFNYVQLLHRQELAMVTRWWKETNMMEELGYARDRIVELYFWAMAGRFEPQFSASRIAAIKYSKFISLVDDTYDAYGTPLELQLFTEAIDRCDMSAIGLLPDYMEVLYRGLMKLFDETEVDMENKGRSYSAHHAKEEFKKLVRAYHMEAKWANEGYIPTLSEYMENGLTTGAYGAITAAFFTGIEKFAGIKEYEWLQANPIIDRSLRLHGRLLDDIGGHKEEQERGDCASGVECCMKEKRLNEEEAVIEIKKICEDAWKDMNQESMRPAAVGMQVIRYFVDFVRISAFIYRSQKDSYTDPVSLKNHIKRLLLDPLPL